MRYSPPHPERRCPAPSDLHLKWFDWLVRFFLVWALTGLIIRGHGCHPGGHEDDIDDELVHRENQPR